MFRLGVAVIAGFLAFGSAASAQNYPSGPITMIVPFAAGGPTDTLARIVAARMSETLGQQVLVENVTGTGGQTGSKRVAIAKPDGYTIGIGTVGTHAQGQSLYKEPFYNPVRDFTPVTLLAELPIALIARKDLPASNLKEFAAYAKANQDKMTFGSAGAGSATHLGCVVVNEALGITVTHVPYRGSGPANKDLQGGRIDYLCDIVSTAKPQVDGGTVKGIAILAQKRSPALPNLPTALEQGFQNMEAYTWNAIFLPRDAPDAVVKKLADAASQALDTPSVKERLANLGAIVAVKERRAPDYLATFVKSEIAKWATPIKASGLSID